tara:strand:- start:146 stop:1006 length:861 start_codon:yes stop_codon:yes gene_type:complete
MKRARYIWLLIIPLTLATFVRAWGLDGHRRLNYIASRQLNGQFGRFLKQNSEALKWYATAPDYNRAVDPNELPRHFIDTDYYDQFPFENIPLDYEELVTKYGENNLAQWGIAPWAIDTTCDRIIALFEDERFEEAVYYLGVLGHYIADLHMPLHTVKNYNGQFSGNDGIHFRWEARLVDDYVRHIKPIGKVEAVVDPVSFAMDIVRESFQFHKMLLTADTKARKILSDEQAKALDTRKILSFEKPYLDILYNETEPILKERLGRAVFRITSIWQYCWEQAGRPKLP